MSANAKRCQIPSFASCLLCFQPDFPFLYALQLFDANFEVFLLLRPETKTALANPSGREHLCSRVSNNNEWIFCTNQRTHQPPHHANSSYRCPPSCSGLNDKQHPLDSVGPLMTTVELIVVNVKSSICRNGAGPIVFLASDLLPLCPVLNWCEWQWQLAFRCIIETTSYL